MAMMNLIIDDIIKSALKEDINYLDITTQNLIAPCSVSSAQMVAVQNGIIAGSYIASRVFNIIDPDIKIINQLEDGTKVKKGDVILSVEAKTSALLQGERTALNLIGHLSGIATATAAYVNEVKGTGAIITETRKTLPGLRAIQKYAVCVGGGKNHRFNLSDAVMIKDNHISAYKSLTEAVKTIRSKIGHMVKIEVEVRSFEELNQALSCGVDVIMLDNMSMEDMAKAVKITNKRAVLEASGNITLDNVKKAAQTGVDIISIGALTHSVKAFDISMRIN